MLRTLIFTGVLAVPGIASAQDLIFGGSERSGFTFGGGIGLGNVACEGECQDWNAGGGLDAHMGMVWPRLAVVLDVWGMRHTEDMSSMSQGVLTAGLRVWPTRHMWVQAGAGAARLTSNDNLTDQSDTLPAAMGAVGYEVLSLSGFALDISLRAGTGLHDDAQLRTVQLGVGASFY